jgi:hypothetical protein
VLKANQQVTVRGGVVGKQKRFVPTHRFWK